MLLTLLVTVLAGWCALALLTAIGIGRAVHIADDRETVTLDISSAAEPTESPAVRRLTLVSA